MKKQNKKHKCNRDGCNVMVEQGQNYCSVPCYNGWKDKKADVRAFSRRFK